MWSKSFSPNLASLDVPRGVGREGDGRLLIILTKKVSNPSSPLTLHDDVRAAHKRRSSDWRRTGREGYYCLYPNANPLVMVIGVRISSHHLLPSAIARSSHNIKRIINNRQRPHQETKEKKKKNETKNHERFPHSSSRQTSCSSTTHQGYDGVESFSSKKIL